MNKPPKKKGTIDRSETFDEFLDKQGLLAETEEATIKVIGEDRGRRRAAGVREKD